MTCERCELLESIRYDRIKKCVALYDLRERKPDRAQEITKQINAIEVELNEAWRKLDQHRRTHAA